MRVASLLGAVLIAAQSAAAAELPPEKARLFDYRVRPVVDVQGPPPQARGGLVYVPLDFESPKGGRVSALLVTPEGGRSPGVLIAPDLGRDRNHPEVREEAAAFARAGIAALVVDAPPDRHAPHTRPWGARRDKVVLIQTVVDLRRALDVLSHRVDVSGRRFAFAGHGFGARAGALLCAVDKRLRACALSALHPRPARGWAFSVLPAYRAMRGDAPLERRRAYARIMAPLEPQEYLGAVAPRRLYLQFARVDPLLPVSLANVTIARAGRTAKVAWYEGETDLAADADARRARVDWIRAIMKPET